jgi:hypothetical protein
MSSLREAFTEPDVAQGDFYSAQQIRYQEVEPNRFVPDAMKGNLGIGITNDTLSQFDRYDPYTETVSNRFTTSGMNQLLQGQADTTDQETYCRGFTGAASIPRLLSDQEAQGNLPIRCGWRYKGSPGGGAPLVSQAALGTVNGPLNAQGDPLGNGVEWIWDLRRAQTRHLRDFTATLPASAQGLTTAQAAFSNTAWCSQTNQYIEVDQAGNPLQGYTCATNAIVTNPANFPRVPSTAVTSMLNANTNTLAQCMRPGNNPSLSRDCLLQAIKTNGCSTDGTLYMAVQSAQPTASSYSQYLQTQPVFLSYQSRQGDNKITEELFNKEQGSWDLATREIQKLHQYTQTAQDPLVKVAAEDLCLSAGKFDTYDFCADLTESTAIGGVDLKCMQNYWQEKNGKPAGLLYPRTTALNPELGTIQTWGEFRNAVDQLKTKVNSTNPIEQRTSINNFLGVTVSSEQFSPLNIDGLSQQFALGGQPLMLWVDAKDGGTLTIDQNNRVRNWGDKSGRNNSLTQMTITSRPTYVTDGSQGIEFSSGLFLDIPNAYPMVAGTFTIFLVEKRKRTGGNWILIGTEGQTNKMLHLGYRSSTRASMAFYANDTDFTIPAYLGADEPVRIWSFVKPTGQKRVFINGSLVAGGIGSTTGLSGWNGASLGKHYQGVVYEMLIFNPSLSDDRRQKIEGYLAHKWGLANNLPTNQPFKTSAP